jgi:hypothetical protein
MAELFNFNIYKWVKILTNYFEKNELKL